MAVDLEKQRIYRKAYREKNRERLLEYGRVYHKAYREDNPEKYREQLRKSREKHKEERRIRARVRRQAYKLEVLTYYSEAPIPKCKRCGIDDIDVLCIDHTAGNGAEHRKELKLARSGCGTTIYRWLKQEGYPEGYQTLCYNCNRKKALTEDRYNAYTNGTK